MKLVTAGFLRCGQIDFHQPAVVRQLITALRDEVRCSPCYRFEINGSQSVRTVSGDIPSVPGWYIICDGERRPLYVGEAGDLRRRLVFRDAGQNHGSERSFITAFLLSGMLSNTQVVVIREAQVTQRLGIARPLNDLDRGNVEKLIRVFRERIYPARQVRRRAE